jgi:hypothetical protein
MILDGFSFVSLALGSDKRVIEPGDTSVHIAPQVSVVTDVLQPTIFAPGATTISNLSGLFQVSISRVNAAAISNVFATLPAGLYKLQFLLSSRSNFTTIGTSIPDVSIRMTNQGGTIITVLGAYAQIGAFGAVTREMDVLLLDQSQVELRVEILGVGQNIDALAQLNAVRRI